MTGPFDRWRQQKPGQQSQQPPRPAPQPPEPPPPIPPDAPPPRPPRPPPVPSRQGTAASYATGGDKRKQSLYFPEEMLNEIIAEANRQDRSLSWVVQQAWRIARGEIAKFPSVTTYGDR